MFVADDEISALLRKATALADDNDWDGAFSALEAAKAGMIESSVFYPMETWCKYPLYLARAGRLDESMREFDWLLSDLPRRARKESFLDDPDISMGSTSKKTIYLDKIRHGKRVIKEKCQVARRHVERGMKKRLSQNSRTVREQKPIQ